MQMDGNLSLEALFSLFVGCLVIGVPSRVAIVFARIVAGMGNRWRLDEDYESPVPLTIYVQTDRNSTKLLSTWVAACAVVASIDRTR